MKLIILAVTLLSLPFVSADWADFNDSFNEFYANSPVFDTIIELVVALATITSFIFMEMARRKTEGPLLKEGFKYIALGLLILSVGFVVQTISEIANLEESAWEEIFKELFTIAGVILIMIGPIKIYGHTKRLSEQAKKK